MFTIQERGHGWAILRPDGSLYAGPFGTRERCEDLARKIGLEVAA